MFVCGQSAVLVVKNLGKEFKRGRPQCLGLKRGRGRGVDKSDAKKVAVVESSFAVDAGEIFGLLGPNGAGKSTTLNAIIAETRPTRGQVDISCVEKRCVRTPWLKQSTAPFPGRMS